MIMIFPSVFIKNKDIYLPGMLFAVLMIFMPLYERYAYKFFYASLYALFVAFYSVFVKNHKMTRGFIFLLRTLSFVYVAFIALRHNIGFAVIGFLTIYQITRLLDGSFFKNYVMSFLIYLGIFYLSIPNHGGIWILLYSALFIAVSIYFLLSHFLYYFNAAAAGGETGSKDLKLFRIARIYTIYVVFLTLIIFIFMPRLKLNFLNPFHFRFGGISSIFSFNSIENIRESSSIIMRIVRDGDSGTHYKMKSFNRYWSGRREWIATGFGSRRVTRDAGGKYIINRDTAEITLAPGEIVNAVYYIKSNADGYVPHLYLPLSFQFNTSILYNDFIENLYASEAEGTIKSTSFVINPGEEILRRAQGPDPPRIASYYYLMYPDRLSRIRRLARQITGPYAARYDKVNAIVNYLQNNYRYTTAVGDLYDEYKNSSYDPNEVFLFIIKAGHCEFFASAMTLMCQSVGIPARLVSGFASPEYNENGGYFLVRGSDAHAWVEVYFPAIGFVTFDPTAASAENERSRLKLFSFLNKYIDSMNFYIENYVSYYSNDFFIKLIINGLNAVKKTVKFAAEFLTLFLKNNGEKTDGDFKKFIINFEYNLFLFSPFFLFIFIMVFSSKIKYFTFKLLSLFLSENYSYRIAKIISLNNEIRMDFYEKFLRVFAARGLTKRPSETPNEFNNRIFKAKILSAGDYNECEKIAKLFYMIKCSMKQPSAAMLEEADLAVMKIMGKIKTSAVIFKNK